MAIIILSITFSIPLIVLRNALTIASLVSPSFLTALMSSLGGAYWFNEFCSFV
jgi:hypothetical protein